jgi:hypothetical protein
LAATLDNSFAAKKTPPDRLCKKSARKSARNAYQTLFGRHFHLGKPMGHISGEARFQATLFPVMLDELVASDAMVRVIDAWVETLDLPGLGFAKAQAQIMGRPPYDSGRSAQAVFVRLPERGALLTRIGA